MLATHRTLIEKDMQYNWHPCSQMKDYESFKPLVVSGASGNYIKLKEGKQIIDAISSWWCKSLGHQHPRLKKALLQQMERFEHIIFANTTHDLIVKLSEKLASLTSSLNKSFYAGDGSSAVEIALKMSVHARKILGETKKTKFLSLENSYHGETVGALSVSDIGIYRDPYQSMLFNTHFITNIPYVNTIDDPLWMDSSVNWNIIEKLLEPHIETTTAVIIEPILQGAGGMKIYSQDFLKRLCLWTKKHNIHLIADEIMTGIGRTGKMLASEYAMIEPDFLCLSKGLTSGWIPFSVVLTSDVIYQTFYDDYKAGKAFLHSHTFSGNALGASLALETLAIIEEENLCHRANQIGKYMYQKMLNVQAETKKITNVRTIGAVVAADLISQNVHRRLGFEVYQKAVALGALLRPLGNTIYWLLPLNTDFEVIDQLAEITKNALHLVDFGT